MDRSGRENQFSRRTFVRGAAAGLGGALLTGNAAPAFAAVMGTDAEPVQPTLERAGLQLYTVSDQIRQAGLDATLERVREVGYRVVEFAGYGDRTPEQVRATLDRLGMSAPSTHIGLGPLRQDYERTVQTAQTVGHRYITVPSLGADNPPPTVDGWKRVADTFNEFGQRLRGQGLTIAFHNHQSEFIDVGGGRTGMDVFVAETDPNLVSFELDLGWAVAAGQDPLEWFRRYPGRFTMWHVKDVLNLPVLQERQRESFAAALQRYRDQQTAGGAQPAGAPAGPGGAGGPGAGGPGAGGPGGQAAQQPPAVSSGPVPVGAGNIDFKPIFEQWQVSGLEHYFIEQDGAANWPGGSLAGITTSYRNIRNLLT